MKKLLILSGKGGTGKTTVATSFIHLLNSKSYADCDVDAPNMHIIVKKSGEPEKKNFFGLQKAVLDETKCIGCKKCIEACRFHAISMKNQERKININPYNCEGCGVCEYICPKNAIKMEDSISGETQVYKSNTVFSTAKLKMGAGASGKLVSEVKKNMQEIEDDNEIAIIDGSPGIGCPVIASVTGVDMVLIVTEPTISGISDLKRIIATVKHFNVKCAVCINKYDINVENTREIESYCNSIDVEIAGKIPYDKEAVNAVNMGKSIVEINCIAGQEINNILNNTIEILKK